MSILKSIYGFFGSGTEGTKNLKQYTDQYFIDWITNTNLLKINTKKNYLNHILTIKTDLFDGSKSLLWIILHPVEFTDELLRWSKTKVGKIYDHVPTTTLRALVTVIISLILHHQDLQEQYPNLLKEWRHTSDEISEPLTDQIDSNKPNPRQEKAFMPFEEICKIRDRLSDGSDAKLLLSLYTMIEPLRSNFNRVRIYQEEPKGKEKGNYIVLGDENKLVIQQFKTDEIYDPLVEELPKQLVEQIYKSLERKPREYLFVMSNDQPYDNSYSWNKWANRLVKKTLNNDAFTLTMFRHVYLSHISPQLKEMNRAEKKVIAKNMQHNLDTQSKYIFTEKK